MRTFIFAGLVLSVCLFGDAAKLPSSWKRCSKSDKEFLNCLQETLEDVVHKRKQPTPELSLITWDPLDIPELYIGEGKGPVNVAQHFKNVQLHGLTNVKVTKVGVDFKNKKLTATSLNPELRLAGDYTMKGRVLLLPIVGEGKCNVTLLNMEIDHVLTWEEIQKKGKTFMKAVDYTTKMRPERVIFNFENLFDGNKELGENINRVLNDNQKEVFDDVKEGYEKSFGLIFLDLSNRVLMKVPESEVFLE